MGSFGQQTFRDDPGANEILALMILRELRINYRMDYFAAWVDHHDV